ncbi:hypothetical protein JCM5350_003808 [Sporobolomyces pararoseus]
MTSVPGAPTSSGQKRSSTSQETSTVGRTKTSKTRQRASLSCKECRRLKLKCDREFPCSSCKRRGREDICPDGMSKPPGRALEIQAEFSLLGKRIEFLENLVTELGGGDKIPPPLKLQHAARRPSSFSKEVESQIEHASSLQGLTEEREGDHGGPDLNGTDEEGEKGASEAADEEEAKLIIGVGSLSIGDDNAGRYLGASAAPAYFFDDEDDEEEQEEDKPRAEYEGQRVISLGTRHRGSEEIETYRSMLPPIETARQLAVNYYNFLAFQFVPLAQKDFFEDYLPSAYTPNDPSPTKLGAVYMILSLGTLFDPNRPSTFSEEAQHFFLRSHAVLAAAKALSQNTLATSQTLQLCGSFLLCQHNLKEGGETFFPLLGVASRLLVTQALHRDGALFGLQGEELDRRRRVFWEFTTIERMQAYISGRPYMLQDSQFDTKFPTNASPFDIAKWKLGTLIGKIINEAFSISSPTYSTILKLDEEHRNLVRDSPKSLRSGALPENAFLEKPQFVPQMPSSSPPTDASLIEKLQNHTMDQMFAQVLFYLHKPAFANALLHHSKEPLQSPHRASVEALALETSVYLVAVAKSWTKLDPVLCPRWWHIYFHAFAAAVSQASLVIKSPSSLLAPHSWTQLKEAVSIFEIAGASGAPCSMYTPRLKVLQEKAYTSLQNLLSVPFGLGDGGLSDALLEGEIARSILNPPVRLERKSKTASSEGSGGASPSGSVLANSHGRSSTSPHPPRIPEPNPENRVQYNRFDTSVFPPQYSTPSLPPQSALPALPIAQQYAAYQDQYDTPVFPTYPSLYQSEIEPDSFRPIQSSLPSLPANAAPAPPLDTYSVPLESCLEFGGFATDFPASQDWAQQNQVPPPPPPSQQSQHPHQQHSQGPYHFVEPTAFPSYFNLADFAPQ